MRFASKPLLRPVLLRCATLSLAIALAGASASSAFAQSSPASVAALETPPDEVAPGQTVSDSVVDLAGWVLATEDNRGLPFAVIDKTAAQILIFGVDGKLQGMASVLIGSAVGDTSAEGVGDRELKDIPKIDRTTPAGRFLAGYGPAAGGERVLWVDYATSVSIHPVLVSKASKREKRKERLASAKPDDNRITHGCINVSADFYKKIVSKVFKDGGIFYVLPDTMTAQEAFPGYAPPALLASATAPLAR